MHPHKAPPNPARVTVETDRTYLVTPYSEDFLRMLKLTFRWFEREWSPSATAWIVHGEYNQEQAIGLVQTFWPGAEIIRE